MLNEMFFSLDHFPWSELPDAGIGAFIAVGVIYLIVQIVKVRSKLRHLPRDEREKVSSELTGKINKIYASNQNLEVKVDTLMGITLKILKDDKPSLIQSCSPLRLTEEGEKVCRELSIHEAITANWAHVRSLIDIVDTSNPYDLQKRCYDISTMSPREVFGEETSEKIKLKAFQMGMPAFSILQAAAVVIRDRYFEEKGINVNDMPDE